MLAILNVSRKLPAMTNWFTIGANCRKTHPMLGKERRLTSVALRLK
jgi:hypothetical protein